jgi:hypothetical protein
MALLETLVIFSNTFGSQHWLASDDGSQLQKFHSSVSPLPSNQKLPSNLPKIWRDLLEGSNQRKLREEAGSTFRKYVKSRHACVGAAEKMVMFLKSFLLKCHLFKRNINGRPTMDLLEFQLYLSKVQNLANSRPLYLHKDQILSVADLSTVSQAAAPHTGSCGLTKKDEAPGQDADLFAERLETIQKKTNILMVSLAENLCPLLLEVQSQHPTNKDGPVNHYLNVGDVVLDRIHVIASGHLTASLCKVILLSEDSRWALVSRIRPSTLSREAHRLCLAIKHGRALRGKDLPRSAVITVGRQVSDLHLVAKHFDLKGEGFVCFNQGTRQFDFGLCLAKVSSKEFAPACLVSHPEDLVNPDMERFSQSPEEWMKEKGDLEDISPGPCFDSDSNGEEESDGETGDGIPSLNLPEDTDPDPETETGAPVRTRSGRVSRQPDRLQV